MDHPALPTDNLPVKMRSAVRGFAIAFILMLSILPISTYANSIGRQKNVVIVGAGQVGLVEAYGMYKRAQENNEDIRITIVEKNADITQTTAANIRNSHTPEEVLEVLPRGGELAKNLAIPFNEPGGIRINDVSGVNDSESTKRFLNNVETYGLDHTANKKHTDALLKIGKAGMLLWKNLFESSDERLRKVLSNSNFNQCCEVADGEMALHKGYRIDLIYSMQNAREHANAMVEKYHRLGYKNSKLLSPDEVATLDPSLVQFCNQHSTRRKNGNRQWKPGSVAFWRPGGCIDTEVFIPEFAKYLKKEMGTYTRSDGAKSDRFRILFNKEVSGVIFDKNNHDSNLIVAGLQYLDGTNTQNDPLFKNAEYVFCPGEAVGTLSKLGFEEPSYAAFAGTSLSLTIDNFSRKDFARHNHCMEVHKEDVILAWQSRVRDGKLFLGTAGTKAYYGDKNPSLHDEFAMDRCLLQLRLMNDVLPSVPSLALNRDTRGEILTYADLKKLEDAKIAKRWIGRRGVAYDGFPTLGNLYRVGTLVTNARTTTHIGSRGGSLALIVSLISASSKDPKLVEQMRDLGLEPMFIKEVLRFADSRRTAKHT